MWDYSDKVKEHLHFIAREAGQFFGVSVDRKIDDLLSKLQAKNDAANRWVMLFYDYKSSIEALIKRRNIIGRNAIKDPEYSNLYGLCEDKRSKLKLLLRTQ